MELRRLRYFLTIAEEGSLGQASRTLGIAQPALGRQIQLLESELGVKLFQRMPKGMRLTDEGEYLKERLIHPLRELDAAIRNVRAYPTKVEATLNIGLPPAVARLMGARLLHRLLSEMPNLSVRIIAEHSPRLATEMSRGTIDMALLSGAPNETFFCTVTLREPLMLVGSSTSALAGKSEIAFEDIAQYPLILPRPPQAITTKLQKLALRFGFDLRIAVEIDSTDIAKDMCKSGEFYSVMTPLECGVDCREGGLVSVPIATPDACHEIFYTIRPHWPIHRKIYDQIERILFETWMDAVDSGEWPATWVQDRKSIASMQNSLNYPPRPAH